MNRVNKMINVKHSTELARQLSNLWIDNKYYLTEPIHHTVFAFMPIRHERDLDDIKNLVVMLECMEYMDSKLSSNIIFTKFRDTTIRNLIALKLSNI
jgi:hypothetical protein